MLSITLRKLLVVVLSDKEGVVDPLIVTIGRYPISDPNSDVELRQVH